MLAGLGSPCSIDDDVFVKLVTKCLGDAHTAGVISKVA